MIVLFSIVITIAILAGITELINVTFSEGYISKANYDEVLKRLRDGEYSQNEHSWEFLLSHNASRHYISDQIGIKVWNRYYVRNLGCIPRNSQLDKEIHEIYLAYQKKRKNF